MKIKIDDIVFEKLAKILKENELSEIEYKEGEVKIRLSRMPGNGIYKHVTAPEDFPKDESKNEPETIVETKSLNWNEHPGAVKSPIVGTCYLAPEPGAQNYISVGDVIQKDQPLMIIEAMKVMNLIKAPREGKIVHIAVGNTEPIEYGQLLVVIE